MDKAFLELGQWLARHRLPVEGVQVRIIMPDGQAAYDAGRALASDLDLHNTLHYTVSGPSEPTLNGIRFRFTYPEEIEADIRSLMDGVLRKIARLP